MGSKMCRIRGHRSPASCPILWPSVSLSQRNCRPKHLFSPEYGTGPGFARSIASQGHRSADVQCCSTNPKGRPVQRGPVPRPRPHGKVRGEHRGVSEGLPLYLGLPNPIVVIEDVSGRWGGRRHARADPIDPAPEGCVFFLAVYLLLASKAFVRIPPWN